MSHLYRSHLRILDGVKINRVIRTLILSDFIILSAFGLMSPIFAIFLLENIQGGSAKVAGFATMAVFLSRAIFQIPIAAFVDRCDGEQDDFWFLLLGSVGFSLIPIAYLFASLPVHIYIIEAAYGLLLAIAYPPWYALFTRHIDERKEGLEWAAHDTAISGGIAVMAGAGGVIATAFGFKAVFIAVSALSLFGTFLLLLIQPSLKCRPKDKSCLSAPPNP